MLTGLSLGSWSISGDWSTRSVVALASASSAGVFSWVSFSSAFSDSLSASFIYSSPCRENSPNPDYIVCLNCECPSPDLSGL